MWNRDWSPRLHCVSVTIPAGWNRKRVAARHMDLDIIRFAGEDRVLLVDEDEFIEHSRTMAYPEELVSRGRRDV